jgi:hypothetical protein
MRPDFFHSTRSSADPQVRYPSACVSGYDANGASQQDHNSSIKVLAFPVSSENIMVEAGTWRMPHFYSTWSYPCRTETGYNVIQHLIPSY